MSHPNTSPLRLAVRTATALVIATLFAGLLAILNPPAAHALSCVPQPNLTIDDYVAGTVPDGSTHEFLTAADVRDRATADMLIGLVTESDELTYDGSTVSMEVTVYRHRGPSLARLTTVTVDSTWGPTLDAGTTWLFPYEITDDGVVLNLCEPTLTVLDDDLDHVLELADAQGTWSIPTEGPGTDGVVNTPAGNPPNHTPWIIGAMLAGLAMLLRFAG